MKLKKFAEDLEQNWKTRIDIPDWRPRVIREVDSFTVLAFRREIEYGFGGSGGCDRIYLTQYSFYEKLWNYHAVRVMRPRSMYRGMIGNYRRYTDKRHCSIFTASSLLIAKEKGRYRR